MNYWIVRLGYGGEFVKLAQEGGFIAIGWNELKDLSWLARNKDGDAKEQITTALKSVYGRSILKKQAASAGQIIRFVREIKKGDIVLVPNPITRQILFGRIMSNYFYAKKKDACAYRHRRRVKWIREISRDTMSQSLKNSTGSLLTVFKLSKHSNELTGLIEGKVTAKNIVNIYKARASEDSIVGETINFRGLIFAPINEQGVVFLFSKVSKDLGIELEAIQQGFPDAVCRVKTPKGYAKRTIEFEFKSSNYDHLPQKSDMLICWEHDWNDCPKDIQIIELKEVIKGLDTKEE